MKDLNNLINAYKMYKIHRIAIIGAGIFVRDTYIPNINNNKNDVILTAILSRSIESIDETLKLLDNKDNAISKFVGEQGEIDFFANANDFCDAVIIVCPIPLLAKYIEKCLSIGIHVLSEKPVAMTSIEATRLIAYYRKNQINKSLWHVAENYRLEPAVKYATELIKEQSIRPKSFSLIALRQQSLTSKFAVTKWRAKPEYHGSYVLDGGIHFIALLRMIISGGDNNIDVNNIKSTYIEDSTVEVGASGSCIIGSTLGTFQIRYGAFPEVVCRLDIYFDDATMKIIQHKGIGYEVCMTGKDTKFFPFQGLEVEFTQWIETLNTGLEYDNLAPEEGLKDLLIIEKICNTIL